MARSRNIKPALFKNEVLGVEDPILTILFISLWCLADKGGRLEDRPLRIKAETFPYRENIDINRYLTELSRLGFIHRYEVNGLRIIQVLNFGKHQHPHKTEAESTLPEYIDETDSCRVTVKEPLNNGSRPADSLNTDSLNTDSLNTDSPTPDNGTSGSKDPSVPNLRGGVAKSRDNPPEKKPKKSEEAEPLTRQTWGAYCDAYYLRYGAEPVRNSTITGQLAQFVKRIGKDESPYVAAFYVHHNNQFYVTKMHSVGVMLSDAEKLRTEWATKRTVTNTQARQIDRKQTTAAVFDQLMQEQEDKQNVAH
jgi:hypothetical protein